MTQEKKFFAPKIYPLTRTIKDKWFVKYWVKDYIKGCLIPKKIVGYLNHIDNLEEREAEAKRYCDMLENNELPPNAKGARRLLPKEVQGNFASIATVLKSSLKNHANDFYTEPGKIRYNNLKSKANTLLLWLANNKLQKLTIGKFTVTEARQFLNYLVVDKKLTPQTRNHYRIDLTMLWDLLIQDEIVKENIWRNIKLDKTKSKPFLKHPEFVQAIIEKEMPANDMQLYIACWLIYGCYMRPVELSRLKIGNIDFDRDMLYISDDICLKSGERKIFIPAAISEAMKKLNYSQYDFEDYLFSPTGAPGQKRITYHYLRKKWSAFRTKFNIDKRYKLYGLKHTGNTKMAQKGINMKMLQTLNGHHNLDYLQKNYTSEFSVEDIMWLKQHQPLLGEPVITKMDSNTEQMELLKTMNEAIKELQKKLDNQ